MSKPKKIILYSFLSLAAIYILFFPACTPELAVRRHLLFTNPLHVFSYVQKGPMYSFYAVPSIELSSIWLKKTPIGWYIESSGTGP
ncbi:hypothetical protein FHS17_006170 [Paenibacillus lupini]|nr:hypothetical protein [Paenibacillus lupini]